MDRTTRRKLTYTLDDQAEQRYQEVTFEVPSPAASIGVRVDVAGGDEMVVDLGCRGANGWRGWSGGARRDYVITETAATTGYLPGAPEPGEWAVVLGLHKVPAAGVQVTVEISIPADREPDPETLAPIEARQMRGSDRGLPAPTGLTWYAGDLHAHTLHSDGAESIDQLAARAVRSGLDFCAVTDHNTVSHHRLLPEHAARQGVVLVPGQELTSHRGHANAFGDIGWIDFRRPAEDWMTATIERGGLFSVNHPISDDCSFQHRLSAVPPALELWHISWFADLTHTGPWAYLRALTQLDPDARTPVLIGGSDFHSPNDSWTLGTPTTWVAAAEPTSEAILAGLLAGRTAISLGVRADTTPDPLHTPILLRLGDELIAIDAPGTILVDREGGRRRVPDVHSRFANWGVGPYHLEDDRRRVLAISA